MTDGLTIVVYLNATDDRFVFEWDITPYTSFAIGARAVMHRPGTFPHTQDGFTIGPGQEARIITIHHTHIHQESHNKDWSDTTTLQVFTDPDDNPGSDWRYYMISDYHIYLIFYIYYLVKLNSKYLCVTI